MKKIQFNENWNFTAEGKEPRMVTLPHDAMLEGGRAADSPTKTGGAFFKGGRYIYEKRLDLSSDALGKSIVLEIEGCYPSAEVFLNGEKLGTCAYGYSDYFFPLSSLRENNVIRVECDNTNLPNSRWYSGAGLYRPVNLYEAPAAHIKPEGIRVETVDAEKRLVTVMTAFSEEASGMTYKVELLDGTSILATEEGIVGDRNQLTLQAKVAGLWTAENPQLYTCRVTLFASQTSANVKDDASRTDASGAAESGLLDTAETTFGIREISWSDKGLFINGKETLLRGGCLHHDNGVVGAETYREAEFRKVSRLKAAGFNAIRSAHNPAGKYLLEACDALGMYVLDEGWDMWYKPKNKYDYASSFRDHYEDDIRSITAKDFNHPSVIMYSIGNEVTEPKDKEGVAMAKALVSAFHKADPTRPVTAGINITLLMLAKMGIDLTASGDDNKAAKAQEKKEMNSTAYNEMMSTRGAQMNKASANPAAGVVSKAVLKTLDIAGYNYATARYKKDGRRHQPILGTETYDYELYDNWALVESLPYLVGDFMWTSWDYLGEVGIGAWHYDADSFAFEKKYPWLLADTGAFDILGNPTEEALETSVIWDAAEKPQIAVTPVDKDEAKLIKAIWRGSNGLPSWSYADCEGHPAKIRVYVKGKEAELFLNGVSLGKKKLVKNKASFETSYQPGILKAVVFDDENNIIGENTLTSATGTGSLRIAVEQKLTKDNIYYVDARIVGENGEVFMNRDQKLSISAEGAEILGFGSAAPRTEDDFTSGIYTTYHGRALAVVRKAAEKATVTVRPEGLEEKSVVF